MTRFGVAAFCFVMASIATGSARADLKADAVACDSKVPEVRIAGCTRALANKRLPKRFLSIVLGQRGGGYVMLRRFREALPDLDKAIAIQPTSISLTDRGLVYMEFGNIAAAIADYDRAIQLDPKNVWPLNNKALALISRGDFDGAIALYNRAILLNPKEAKTVNGRGTAWQGKRDFDRALADFDTAIQLDPKYEAPYLNIGIVYVSKGETDRALSYYEQAIRLNPLMDKAYANRAAVYMRRGEYEAALKDANRAIELNATNPANVSMRGNVFTQRQEYDRAVVDFTQALKLDPDFLAANYSRGSAYQKLGDYARARADFEKVIKAEPDNGSAYAGKAMVLSAQGDIDRALENYDKAINLDPSHAGLYALRGLTREKIGAYDGARADFQKSLSLDRIHFIRSRGLLSVTEDSKQEQDQARARLLVLGDASAGGPPSVVPPLKTEPNAPPRDLGRRIALIIGNGAYENASPLQNPANDARAIGSALKDMGFEVSQGIDLSKDALQKQIATFLREAPTAKLLVIFYAGHGMQIDGKNYLVPVDARFDDPSSFTAGMLDMDTILSSLDGKLTTNIVILDACRDNPLVQPAQPSEVASRGLARARAGLAAPSSVGAGETAGAGTLIAFATAPGQVASDGSGANSPFSSALTRHIATPGLEVQQMMTRVRAEVVASTKNKQVPWANSALVGEVFLRP